MNKRAFIKRVEDYLMELGAVPNDQTWKSYPFKLDTPAGSLLVKVLDAETIFCRFLLSPDELFRFFSQKTPGLNIWSGKYNLHFGKDQDEDEKMKIVKAHFRAVM